MATFNNGESGLSVRNKLNDIINKVEGVTSINNDIDVTGTVTADGLTVDGNDITQNGTAPTIYLMESDATDLNTRMSSLSGDFQIRTIDDAKSVNKIRFALDHSTGDVSFYEDTGTTPKMVWSASAESLGIGTSSPNAQLQLTDDIWTGAGTAADPSIKVGDNNTGFYYVGGNVLGVTTNGTERMRIDASGTLLVGKTAATISTDGAELRPTGEVVATTNGLNVAYFNRRSSDGSIAEFRKDGTTVGSIGVYGGSVYVDGGASNYSLMLASDFRPRTSNGAANLDATVDLGDSGARFKDLYLSGGVYLGGTGAANLLDDYELGYFSPTIVRSTTNPTVTYTTSSTFNSYGTNARGRYVVIGNKVFVEVDIRFSAITGGSGIYRIANLPFAAAGGYSGGVVTEHSSGVTYGLYSTLNFEVQSLGSTVNLIASGSGLTSGNGTTISDHSGYIIGSFSYTIA